MTTPRRSSGQKKGATKRTGAAPKVTKNTMVLLQSLASTLSNGGRFAKRGGMQYGGERDIYKVAGYPAQDSVDFETYWAMYKRGDIAGRIVDMPAKTTWRTPPEVIEKDKPDGTKFTKAFDDMAKRLRVWNYFTRVDRLAGIGRYATLVIGVRGADDQALKTPLTTVSRPEDIIYLAPYSEGHSEIHEWEKDPGNPRFGFPRLYKIKLSDNAQFAEVDATIHASRVLHVAEDVLEDEVYGRPRLERSLNRLMDLEKVSASTGEAYWNMVTRVLQAKIDPEMEISGDEKKFFEDLDEKLMALTHDLRRQFYGQGVELNWLPSDVPNVSQVADFFFSLIAGSAGIPKRIMFGSELGELASSQDTSNYLGTINERQEQFAEPSILRQFIDRMIAIKALPEPVTGEYQVTWPTLFEDPEDLKEAANLKRAQAAAALTPVGGNPRELVEINDEGRVTLVARDPDEEMELLPLVPPNDDPNIGPDDDDAEDGGGGASDDNEDEDARDGDAGPNAARGGAARKRTAE